MSTDAKEAATNEYVTMTDHSTGKSYDLPVINGSVGPKVVDVCLLYTSPSPRDGLLSRMPSSA